ncbi:MAG: ATP synthase F1 subunit delta [Elusimicrobiota bacterium]
MNISDISISKKYAFAYFLAQGESVEKKKERIFEIASVVKQNADFFINPSIGVEVKWEILDKIITDDLKNSAARRLVEILIENKKIQLLTIIVDEFERLYFESKKHIKMEVRARHPLSEKEKNDIILTFKEATGITPVIKFVEDKSIIGGFIMRWDDRIFDSTINQKINLLEKEVIEKEII